MTKKAIAFIVVAVLVVAAVGTAAAGGGDNPSGGGGSAGAPIQRGPAKAKAVSQFAVVSANGSLARSYPRNGITSSRLSTGDYEVLFPRKVRNCAYNATIGLSGISGAANPALISVVGRASKRRGVFVDINDVSLNPTDRGFHLTVTCPPL